MRKMWKFMRNILNGTVIFRRVHVTVTTDGSRDVRGTLKAVLNTWETVLDFPSPKAARDFADRLSTVQREARLLAEAMEKEL